MRSIATLVVAALLAVAVQCSADQEQNFAILPRDEVCSPSQDACAGCGAGYVQCGSDTCYNPTAGETCCSNDYACPASFNCSSTIAKCIPDDQYRRASSCRIGDGNNYNNTGVNTTTTTTTITSTVTSIIATVSATTSSCDLSAATTGLPVTGSVASYGNATTTVALNTTTSTLSLANATSVLPTTNPITLNATRATATISPPITGYTGSASGFQGQSSASLFALGCLLFMSALLL